MFPQGRGGRILLFVGLYLLLSVPPYVALNREIVAGIAARSVPPDPVTATLTVVFALVLLVALVRAAHGVDRYVQFLVWPTDWLSVLVALSFVLAGISWWAVPELVFEFRGGIELNLLYFLVFLGHVPMLLFLSLMTALGLTHEGG